jgi:hypothetical protein
MVRGVQQVSVSLTGELVTWLDQKAEEHACSRSQVLAGILEAQRRREWEELFVEGCRELADEMRDTAVQTHAAQAEVALREPFDADPAR